MKAKSANAQLDFGGTCDCAAIGMAELSPDEKRSWLRLIRTPNIGGVTFFDLLAHFGTAAKALEALPSFVKFGSRITAQAIPSLEAIDAELAAAEAAGMQLHALGEPGYPPLLAKIEVPPPLIYTKGVFPFWDRPAIGVVGSRQASAVGLKFAAQMSAELAEEGFRVISGLARGIDAAAHRAALPHGTAAVLPGGLDAIYPPEHAPLAEEIAKTGLLISECAPGFKARSQDFPRRNRIISGCCLGVVIVEAAERSGSLITARLAAEQNREVFAVPGHPLEARAAGTNGLIKDGAVFTTSAKDVIEVLRPALRQWPDLAAPRDANAPASKPDRTPAPPPDNAPSLENLIFPGEITKDLLKLLSVSPVDIDDLCRLTGSETRHVNAALLALDLAGRIERHGQRLVSLKP
jgi:DNA processing protein